MGASYAAVSDILVLGKALTAQQTEAAEVLIKQASAKLRQIARKYGREIDSMIADETTGEDFALVVKSVIVQAVCRALDSVSTSSAVQQGTEAIGAYSLTQIYVNAGQSLYFLNNELKDLGLKRQTVGWMPIYPDGEE